MCRHVPSAARTRTRNRPDAPDPPGPSAVSPESQPVTGGRPGASEPEGW